jgi:hypothetical protein
VILPISRLVEEHRVIQLNHFFVLALPTAILSLSSSSEPLKLSWNPYGVHYYNCVKLSLKKSFALKKAIFFGIKVFGIKSF